MTPPPPNVCQLLHGVAETALEMVRVQNLIKGSRLTLNVDRWKVSPWCRWPPWEPWHSALWIDEEYETFIFALSRVREIFTAQPNVVDKGVTITMNPQDVVEREGPIMLIRNGVPSLWMVQGTFLG